MKKDDGLLRWARRTRSAKVKLAEGLGERAAESYYAVAGGARRCGGADQHGAGQLRQALGPRRGP
eukprot:COSAG01_NODE_20495_length_950_cov_1.772033_1_plen_64_part_10